MKKSAPLSYGHECWSYTGKGDVGVIGWERINRWFQPTVLTSERWLVENQRL